MSDRRVFHNWLKRSWRSSLLDLIYCIWHHPTWHQWEGPPQGTCPTWTCRPTTTTTAPSQTCVASCLTKCSPRPTGTIPGQGATPLTHSPGSRCAFSAFPEYLQGSANAQITNDFLSNPSNFNFILIWLYQMVCWLINFFVLLSRYKSNCNHTVVIAYVPMQLPLRFPAPGFSSLNLQRIKMYICGPRWELYTKLQWTKSWVNSGFIESQQRKGITRFAKHTLGAKCCRYLRTSDIIWQYLKITEPNLFCIVPMMHQYL